ncbi:hypothetical protein LIER_42847 [Lithospermum erythrorhizon]|uniref:Growth-regulating factor n=1 Tax=Lithospermum erythrorhizon TaxID=34254 RepID=A0AAV3P358_LITER
MMSASRNTYPFTLSQWRELELQALIFKYMVSGMPIPHDLLHNIRRSFDFSLSSAHILKKSEHTGFNYFQAGFGKKIDPEPGRCRRTDGKKWRCSKEAFQDSKYCERHMHRGRNRSRKPVEHMSTSSTTTLAASNNNTPTAIPISSVGRNSEHSVSSLPYAYPHSVKDYSYGHAMKEVGEHNFFSDASGTMGSLSGSSSVDDSWYQKMGSNLGQLNPKEISFSQSGHNSTYLKLQGFEEASMQQRQHDQSKQAMHHFIDESPPKDKGFWFASEDKLRTNDVSFSNTNLSISMPSSEHDFFMTRNN